MKIYMICNRAVEETHDGLRFQDTGKERAQASFRIANCTIPEDGKGTRASYTILEDKFMPGYDEIADIVEGKKPNLMGTAQVFYDVYQDMLNEKTEKGDTLFFMHGFATDFDSTLDHIYDLYELYIKPEESPIKNMIYVSWPSLKSKLLTYWNDQDDAEATGQMLGRVYSNLHKFFLTTFETLGLDRCKHKIHLMAHSMGCTLLREMLEAIPRHRLFPLFGETILLHSDVEHDVFEPGKPYTKLEPLSERTHIYIHRSDDALRISRFTKNFNKRLGFKGPKDKHDLNDETFVIDTTHVSNENVPLMERVVDHWGYLNRQPVVNHIIQVLRGMDTDDIHYDRKHRKYEQYYIL